MPSQKKPGKSLTAWHVPFVSSIMALTLMFLKIWKTRISFITQAAQTLESLLSPISKFKDRMMEGEILKPIEKLFDYSDKNVDEFWEDYVGEENN